MDIDKNQPEEYKFKHGRGENVTRHLDTVEDYESEEEEYDSGCDESSDSEWNSEIKGSIFLLIQHYLTAALS